MCIRDRYYNHAVNSAFTVGLHLRTDAFSSKSQKKRIYVQSYAFTLYVYIFTTHFCFMCVKCKCVITITKDCQKWKRPCCLNSQTSLWKSFRYRYEQYIFLITVSFLQFNRNHFIGLQTF